MRSKVLLILLSAGMMGAISNSVFSQNCKYEKNDVRDVPCAFSRVTIKGGSVRKISGKVIDPSGAVLIGATVVVYKVAGEESLYVGTQEVDDRGRYCFAKLPAGDYVVKVGAIGFMCADVEVHLAPDDIKVLNSKMKLVSLKLGV